MNERKLSVAANQSMGKPMCWNTQKIEFDGRNVVQQLYHLALVNYYINFARANKGTRVMRHVLMAHLESIPTTPNVWVINF